MDIDFHKGFIVYRKGPGPVFVVPHSGPALETPTSRDDNADTVASLCWLRMGGSLVVSAMPRKMMLGVDFNREPPPQRKSLYFWKRFEEEKDWEALREYRHAYAWVASSKQDHTKRLRIYNDFWKTVKGLGDTVLFIHRKFARMKNFPSIMDVATYKGYGVNRNIMQSVIDNINRDFADFFQKISSNYKNAILMEEKRAVERIMRLFHGLDPSKVKAEYKKNLNNGIKVIKQFAPADKTRRMEKNLTMRSFMSALRAALKADVQPKVTLEYAFSGRAAWSRKSVMFKRKNMTEIEVNAFLNYWYPNEAAEIVMRIIDKIMTMRKLPHYMNGEW